MAKEIIFWGEKAGEPEKVMGHLVGPEISNV